MVDDKNVGKALAPVGNDENARRREKVRQRFWRTLRRAAGQLPFVEDIVASYYCALDSRTPARVRGILLAALAYFVLPFDMVPDFIVGIGFTDDLAVLTAAFTAVQSHVRPEHREAARRALEAEGLATDTGPEKPA